MKGRIGATWLAVSGVPHDAGKDDSMAPARNSIRRWQAVKDFFYGMTGYQFVQHAREMKQDSESLFLLVTLGDLVGVPIMPPVYSLRLLPYVAPKIVAWKRQLARRKEFWEKEEYDLQGI